MIKFILLCILGFMLILSLVLEKRIINPLTLFSTIWFVIVFLGGLGLFGLYEIPEEVYYVILTGYIGFLLGYLSFRFIVLKKKKRDMIEHMLNVQGLCILLGINIILYLIIGIIILIFINNGYTYKFVRTIYLGYATEGVLSLRVFRALKAWYMEPIIYLSIPVLLNEVVNRKLENKKIVILCMIELALYVFCSAGRFIFVYFIIEFFIIYKLKGRKINKKNRRKLYITVAGMIALVFIYTVIRLPQGTTWTIYKVLYMYICGCLPLLSYWINIVQSSGFYSYGMAGFHAIGNILDTILDIIFGQTITLYSMTDAFISSTEKFVPIMNSGSQFNAFVTMFLYFYMDFRYIGVFAGSFLYGGLCSKVYKRVIKVTGDDRTVYIYLLLSQSICTTMLRFSFASINYFLAFIFVYFITLKVKNTEGGSRR